MLTVSLNKSNYRGNEGAWHVSINAFVFNVVNVVRVFKEGTADTSTTEEDIAHHFKR